MPFSFFFYLLNAEGICTPHAGRQWTVRIWWVIINSCGDGSAWNKRFLRLISSTDAHTIKRVSVIKLTISLRTGIRCDVYWNQIWCKAWIIKVCCGSSFPKQKNWSGYWTCARNTNLREIFKPMDCYDRISLSRYQCHPVTHIDNSLQTILLLMARWCEGIDEVLLQFLIQPYQPANNLAFKGIFRY